MGNKNVVLTDANFRSKVLQSDTPWCGHCRILEPEWKKAAGELHEQTGGKIEMGALDATESQQTAGQYGIQGYPTIKIFYPDGRVEDYQGGRTASDFITTGMTLFEDYAEPPELHELTSQKVIDENCKDVQICAI